MSRRMPADLQPRIGLVEDRREADGDLRKADSVQALLGVPHGGRESAAEGGDAEGDASCGAVAVLQEGDKSAVQERLLGGWLWWLLLLLSLLGG